MRFTDRSGEDTFVKLMTDGILLAEIQHDRLLRRYDTIIIDEAHERSLNIDFLLGYLKQHPAAAARPEADHHQRDDRPAAVQRALRRRADRRGVRPHVPGRGALPRAPRRGRPTRRDAIGDAVEELLRERPGDILVFLSGEREIRETADALEGRLRQRRRDPAAVRAASRTADQQRVWKPHKGRRIVLATNVAETSLTVPGIRYVVDPGTARISRYSARPKVQRLPIEPVSQASADQRKGRCGRVAEGIAIRLYSEEDFEERPRFTEPEILRTSLAAVILQMAALDLGDVEDFPFLDPPDRRQVARRHRAAAGARRARRDRRKLTPLGDGSRSCRSTRASAG